MVAEGGNPPGTAQARIPAATPTLPKRTVTSPVIGNTVRQLTGLRNELVTGLPVTFPPRALSNRVHRLDEAIERIENSELTLRLSVWPNEDPGQIASQLLPADVKSADDNIDDGIAYHVHSSRLLFLINPLDRQIDGMGSDAEYDIHIVPTLRDPAKDQEASPKPDSLETIISSRNARGPLVLDRQMAGLLIRAISKSQKSWTEAIAALKALRAVEQAHRIVEATHPTRMTLPPATEESADSGTDDYQDRRKLFLSDVEEFLSESEMRFDNALSTSNVSAGSFYLAVKSHVDRIVSSKSLENRPERNVASSFRIRWLVKIFYKSKSKIRVSNAAITELNKKIEKLLVTEIEKSTRQLQRTYELIHHSAEKYHLDSAVFGLDAVPVLAASGSAGARATEVVRHLASALANVSTSFEVDHEFKGLFGRLMDARMAMLSLMMMVFLIGRALPGQAVNDKVYLYMLIGIGAFALVSAMIAPFAQRIERSKAVERLKITLAEKLAAASDRAYSLSVRDLKSEGERIGKKIDRNMKTLDLVLREQQSRKVKQAAVSTIGRLRTQSVAAQGEKLQTALAKLRTDFALRFSDAIRSDRK